MTPIEVVPVDHLIARLGDLELHLKHIGLASHAAGVRNAITLIQEDLKAHRMLAEGVPVPPGAAIIAMVAALVAPKPEESL